MRFNIAAARRDYAARQAAACAQYNPENDPHDLRGGKEPYGGGCIFCHQMDETCPECEELRLENE